MRTRRIVVAALVGLAASVPIASCGGGGRVICDYAADSGTFVGRLEAVHGSAATFIVQTVQPSNTGATGVAVHAPVVGLEIVVRYGQREQQFLRVDQRYRVEVWWLASYFSGVHEASQECSGGTVHADGSAIDTSLWLQARVRDAIVVVAIACFIFAGSGAVLALRRRNRQRRAVEEIRAAACDS